MSPFSGLSETQIRDAANIMQALASADLQEHNYVTQDDSVNDALSAGVMGLVNSTAERILENPCCDDRHPLHIMGVFGLLIARIAFSAGRMTSFPVPDIRVGNLDPMTDEEFAAWHMRLAELEAQEQAQNTIPPELQEILDKFKDSLREAGIDGEAVVITGDDARRYLSGESFPDDTPRGMYL